MKRKITEAEAEKYADARVMKAQRTDPRYAHAENAEAQAEAEDSISREVWEAIEAEYEIVD